ncbi:hypothetical protein ASE01_22980 [Nocardioides sp. Root190]|uniref:DUF4873 domain-containing protein n=1 Tax=Nocardioides sp. Root190 TaxID=1736488 RepID=UPI000702032A|nr:DUF4873 domain-containing protein [Nocardioides sp. Root190]KRB79598.1 hypothetical protein ASE01_22980 [Nocardioides sp. Root190]
MSRHDPREAYDGPAIVRTPDAEHEVAVTLRGAFSPLDGHFHWYGRVSDSGALAAVRSGATVTVRTEHGEAAARLSDKDPWGRFRVAGTGTPPF